MTIREDPKIIAKTSYNCAAKDIFNGKGRILLNDFRKTIHEPDLTAEDLIEAWQQTYPKLPIEQRTPNVILIDGF
jgi:hypothetical protein